MSRAERKTLDDLLQFHPEGVELVLDNFYDVNDDANPDPLDRVVVSHYDTDRNISYSGVAILKTPEGMSEADVQEFKEYLRGAWHRLDPVAFLRPGTTRPILEPPTGGLPEDEPIEDAAGTEE